MRRIIIDTDPGRDDAAAILLALASPELEVVGIVAVAGNVPLHHTARNALRVVDLSGRSDIPVYLGCDRPIARKLVTSEHVHGQTGLDGYELPEPTGVAREHGVEFVIETVMSAAPGTITLCQLGPLTNAGTALVKEPRIAGRVREIVLMGGACREFGNVTPAAEYNIYADPEAADIVLKSGIPITMAPLDVTHLDLLTLVPKEFRKLYGEQYIKLVDRLPQLWSYLYAKTDRPSRDSLLSRTLWQTSTTAGPRGSAVRASAKSVIGGRATSPRTTTS